jgi:hypothetical protein
MKLENDDDQLMATAAHRYCLGRQSYIVSTAQDWIKATWSQMTQQTQHFMLRDTVEALADNHAGDERIDKPGWAALALWMAVDMGQERLESVRRAVAHVSGAEAYLP